MMKRITSVLIILTMIMAVAFTGCGKKEYRLVKVETYEGDVIVERDGDDELEIFEGMMLLSDDVVSVGDEAELELIVDSDKHLYAEANTTFEIVATGNENKGSVRINILDGAALIEIENKLNDDSTFEVSTPNAVFSVRGTEFRVEYDSEQDETTISVIDGVVKAEYNNDCDDEDIEAGDSRLITRSEVGPVVTTDNAWDMYGFVAVEDDPDAIRGAYNSIVLNMQDYISVWAVLRGDYVARDYMYYDYNQDGRKEVILYLGYYNENNVYMRDVVFLKYYPDRGGIDIAAVNYGEENDASFYADYYGQMARYSWSTSPYESYIYVVHEDGTTLSYVLEAGFDYVESDVQSIGLNPLPLYGDWEMIID